MSEGYIYCLTNETMPGLVKIGEIHTEGRSPDDRARELYTTGVAMPFNIEFAKKVKNPAEAEARIHAFISDKRLPRREFFKTTPEVVRKLFDLIDGEMWVRAEVDEDSGSETSVTRGNAMSLYFTNGLRIRHVVDSDPNKTWIGTYNSTTNKIIYNNVSYTSLSDFAVRHHNVYNSTRASANGWAECQCEVNGAWVTASNLRV
jgi:hypothetical protein